MGEYFEPESIPELVSDISEVGHEEFGNVDFLNIKLVDREPGDPVSDIDVNAVGVVGRSSVGVVNVGVLGRPTGGVLKVTVVMEEIPVLATTEIDGAVDISAMTDSAADNTQKFGR